MNTRKNQEKNIQVDKPLANQKIVFAQPKFMLPPDPYSLPQPFPELLTKYYNKKQQKIGQQKL